MKISAERIESRSWKSLPHFLEHYEQPKLINLPSCSFTIRPRIHPRFHPAEFWTLLSSPLIFITRSLTSKPARPSLNSAKVEIAKLAFQNFHQQRTKWAEFPMDIRNIRLPISTYLRSVPPFPSNEFFLGTGSSQISSPHFGPLFLRDPRSRFPIPLRANKTGGYCFSYHTIVPSPLPPRFHLLLEEMVGRIHRG